MKKPLSPKALTAIVVASVLLLISAGCTGGYFLFKHFLKDTNITENFNSVMESGEVHVVKTLPQSDDYDMWVFGVRDFTVYGKYYYEDGIPESVFDENKQYKFKKVTDDNITPLRNVIRDYERCVDSTKGNDGYLTGDDISEVYDFDMNLLREKSCYYYFEAKNFDTEEISYEEIEIPLEDIDRYFSYTLYIYCDKILYIMHNDT